jgi:hypothetical protein
MAMPRLYFTQNLRRHIGEQNGVAPGRTVREALAAHFATNRQALGYILDDQGSLRRHMNISVDGHPIHDRAGLSDPVGEDSEIHVLQALSGG